LGKSVEEWPESQNSSGLEAKIPREDIFCCGFSFFRFQINALQENINRLSQRLEKFASFIN
jgi:hypothetical protein